MSSRTYKIRIIYEKSKFILSSDGASTIYEIKRAIARKFEISASNIHFLIGEELKSLEFPDQTLLCNSGIRSGETITLQITTPSRRVSSRSSKSKFSQTPDVNGLIMVKRLMPADNSCLFNSIGYALESKTKSYARYLRQIVASYIESDPEKYNEVLLERPNEEYSEWILDDLNWGGAVETEILSRHYGVEICTVDTQNLNFNIFGIDQNYEKRIYVLYDGSHYDAVARNVSEDVEEDMDITVFRTTDRYAYDGVMMLATEINYRQQIKKQQAAQNYENQYNACSKKILEETNNQRSYPQPTTHANYSEISS